jgi:hypothetical protein
MTRNGLYRFVAIASLVGYLTVGYLWMNGFEDQNHELIKVCLFKNITGLPCPSCGTTHSIVALIHGDFKKAVMENPLGIILALSLVIFPIMILIDYFKSKDYFYQFFLKTEFMFRKKFVAIPAIVLVLINWIWAIHKGL